MDNRGWSPMVPRGCTGGDQRQTGRHRKRPKQATIVTVGCDQLPARFHGKQGVCRGLPPVAGGPLPAREEVDLLKKSCLGRSARSAGGCGAFRRCCRPACHGTKNCETNRWMK